MRRFYYVKSNCSLCGSGFFRERANVRKNPSSRPTCQNCFCAIRSGPNSRTFKGKKYKRGKKGGHILVHCPNHPMAKKNFIPEHRLVMEEVIGRMVAQEERVHHIDCDPENNEASNLFLFPNDREHFLAHGSLNKCVAKLMASGVLGFDRLLGRYFVI